MEEVRKAKFKIVYDGKDITADITPNVTSFSYIDNDEKESDEIDLTIEDTQALWRNSWYPSKGSTIIASIGFDDDILISCGTFEIDEITLQGPPDSITIKALAAGFKNAMRTKKSKSFENQTLKQIAKFIADQNKLTLVGNIATIKFERVTQNREKDLAFLARIANEYGYLFSVRDKQLIFTSVFEIENGKAVVTIDRKDIRSYSIKDKTSETFKDANVSFHNPVDGEVKGAKVETLSNKDNVTYKQIASNDSLQIKTKAETPAQAEAKATAALHKKNSEQREGNFSLEGNPLLVAGNNFLFTGLGELSGKYYIKKSTHRFSKSSGYTTDCEIKQISPATSGQKSGTSKTTKGNFTVQNLTNKDNVTYKQITPQ